MSNQPSNTESLKSRILFFIAGIAIAALLSTLDIGGIWAISVGIILFIIFGEVYLFLTGNRSTGQ
jgi:hypothetical protein